MQDRLVSRRQFLKKMAFTTMGLALTGAGGFAYSRRIEPAWVEIKTVQIALKRLQPEFEGLRIVQLSDLHMDQWMNGPRLRGIINQVNRYQPDLVLLTGDYANHGRQLRHDLPQVLQEIKSKEPPLAVLGNHDHWGRDAPLIKQILAQAGVQELANQVKVFKRGQAQLTIAGVDDILTEHHDLDRVLAQMPQTGAAILMAHEPDFADISAATGAFDLQLSGHSHGGQISLPLLGPPILPSLGRKYPAGLYQVGSMLQYTNRGIGMLPWPRLRFNCRPEVTVFTLTTSI